MVYVKTYQIPGIYLTIFTDNTWSYQLWSPVIVPYSLFSSTPELRLIKYLVSAYGDELITPTRNSKDTTTLPRTAHKLTTIENILPREFSATTIDTMTRAAVLSRGFRNTAYGIQGRSTSQTPALPVATVRRARGHEAARGAMLY